MITSKQNPKLKQVHALSSRSKKRREAGAFLAEGVRLVEEALQANWPVHFVLYSGGLSRRGMQVVDRLKQNGTVVDEITDDLMHGLSDTDTSQGIIAVLDEMRIPIPDTLKFVLIPDQVRDPGNLGTLLRSAEAAGVDAVLLPPDSADAFAPKVIRSGMGAHFRLPIQEMGWNEIEQIYRAANLNVILADMGGSPCWEAELREPLALIIGGEAEGASERARNMANQRVSIPMSGIAESLNAAVAGSVLMFEVVRQRKLQKSDHEN